MIKKNDLKDLNSINTILFDIDHTMIYLEDDDIIVKEILDSVGIPYKEEYGPLLCSSIVSTASERIITLETLESEFEKQMPFVNKHQICKTDFRRRVFETELKHVRPIKGIDEVIGELCLQYKIHCFTDWFYDLAVSKVEKIGLLNKISSIISSQNRFSKKDLKSFRILLTELGKEPSEVIMIGDSKTDIHSSKIGIQSILVDYDNVKGYVEDATAIVTKSTDIIKLLIKGGIKNGIR